MFTTFFPPTNSLYHSAVPPIPLLAPNLMLQPATNCSSPNQLPTASTAPALHQHPPFTIPITQHPILSPNLHISATSPATGLCRIFSSCNQSVHSIPSWRFFLMEFDHIVFAVSNTNILSFGFIFFLFIFHRFERFCMETIKSQVPSIMSLQHSHTTDWW